MVRHPVIPTIAAEVLSMDFWMIITANAGKS
jgi:hypothetical protein